MRKGDAVCTGNVDQANLLNSQFHSVFSIRSPLNLAKLCHSKLLNGTASLISLLPESITCKYPSMPDIDISTAGVAKLLSNLNVSKAAGPDSVRPIVLKELSQVITPVITVKAPNIAHLSLLTSITYNKKETNLKYFAPPIK